MNEQLSAEEIRSLEQADESCGCRGIGDQAIAVVERILTARLASRDAEITALQEALEPGKASGIVAAMWHEAVARGHSQVSAKHALTFLIEKADALADRDARLAAVEAVLDEVGVGAGAKHFTYVQEWWFVRNRLRAALHPDPSEASTDA